MRQRQESKQKKSFFLLYIGLTFTRCIMNKSLKLRIICIHVWYRTHVAIVILTLYFRYTRRFLHICACCWCLLIFNDCEIEMKRSRHLCSDFSFPFLVHLIMMAFLLHLWMKLSIGVVQPNVVFLAFDLRRNVKKVGMPISFMRLRKKIRNKRKHTLLLSAFLHSFYFCCGAMSAKISTWCENHENRYNWICSSSVSLHVYFDCNRVFIFILYINE